MPFVDLGDVFFLNRKRDGTRAGRGAMDSKEGRQKEHQQATSKPRLDRRNAVKNFQYQAVGAASWSSSSSAALDEATVLRTARSLDILPSTYSSQTSFRIDGSVEGEVDMLCRTFGLSGPEGFGISVTDWEARKVRSSSDIPPKSSSLLQPDTPEEKDPAFAPLEAVEVPNSAPATLSSESMVDNISRQEKEGEDRQPYDTKAPVVGEALKSPWSSPRSDGGDGGIHGVRPPVIAPPVPMAILFPLPCRTAAETLPLILKPPPSISLPAIDNTSSPWDIVRSLAPDFEKSGLDEGGRKPVDSEEEVEFRGLRLGETSEGFTGTSSYSTMNDDDASSTSTETMFIISPNGKFKTRIRKWSKGVCLGSGSFGTVYEGLSDEGVFFAVKEVSLLDQGVNAQQSIIQLEQEIALLSQFEHENIVQYYGTDKEDTKLFIFLELVTQGSLASLYGKYHLRDTQVSAYTRQILNGLKYLHERNVVHRDIKCANILVHANGSVKLADFGLAKEITKHNLLKSCKGSVYWMAPEVINPSSYGPSADIWSLGCTVLEMLTRQVPYPNMEWQQAFYMIGKGKPPPIPAHLSSDARDFISQCVKVKPDDRPTAAQLLYHAFVKRSLRTGSGSDSSHGEDRWSG